MLLESQTGSGEVIGIRVDRFVVDFEFPCQFGFGNVKGHRRVDFADVAALHRKLPIQYVAERSLEPAGGEVQLGFKFPWLVTFDVSHHLVPRKWHFRAIL